MRLLSAARSFWQGRKGNCAERFVRSDELPFDPDASRAALSFWGRLWAIVFGVNGGLIAAGVERGGVGLGESGGQEVLVIVNIAALVGVIVAVATAPLASVPRAFLRPLIARMIVSHSAYLTCCAGLVVFAVGQASSSGWLSFEPGSIDDLFLAVLIFPLIASTCLLFGLSLSGIRLVKWHLATLPSWHRLVHLFILLPLALGLIAICLPDREPPSAASERRTPASKERPKVAAPTPAASVSSPPFESRIRDVAKSQIVEAAPPKEPPSRPPTEVAKVEPKQTPEETEAETENDEAEWPSDSYVEEFAHALHAHITNGRFDELKRMYGTRVIYLDEGDITNDDIVNLHRNYRKKWRSVSEKILPPIVITGRRDYMFEAIYAMHTEVVAGSGRKAEALVRVNLILSNRDDHLVIVGQTASPITQ